MNERIDKLFSQLCFDTLYCDQFECRSKHYNNLISLGPLFIQRMIFHTANMKLMDSFPIDWIPYHFLPYVSMEIYFDVLSLMFKWNTF